MVYEKALPARLPGYTRRFWQGSHDHRGVPLKPGRVVTLIPDLHASCEGIAYLLDATVAQATFEQLDHREKNGYERVEIELQVHDLGTTPAIVYIAPEGNFAYLGDASSEDIAQQIATSCGPSGRNIDYLLDLAAALRNYNFHDEHVFELESMAQSLSRQA